MVLQRDDRGTEVEQLQQQLEKLGYSIGRINGNFDDRTEEAVKAFQAELGLAVDGIVGNNTGEAIDRAVTGIRRLEPTAPPQVSPAGDFISGNWPKWTIVARGGLNVRSGPGFEFPVESTLPERSAIAIDPEYTNALQYDRIGKPWLVITNAGATQFVRATNQFIEPNLESQTSG